MPIINPDDTQSDDAVVQMVAFDFDGTITTKDTFALFLRYYAGSVRWLANIATLLPSFALYGLKMIDRNEVKRRVVRRFFKGADEAKIWARAEQFSREVIPALVRPQAQACLDDKKARGEQVYIVSASIEHYLKPWAALQGIKTVIATKLEVVDSVLTGEIEHVNCWGEGKLTRIKAEMGQLPYTIIEAYGDSEGDKPLLYAAKASFWRPFRL